MTGALRANIEETESAVIITEQFGLHQQLTHRLREPFGEEEPFCVRLERGDRP